MRKEYIDYPYDLPLRIEYIKIKNIPLHWKNAITLLWVMEGELKIMVETETYLVHRREVEVINANEVYAIEGSDDNRTLVMEINPSFFKTYYDEAEETFFYTNAPRDDINGVRYQKLRTYMARLAYEVVMHLDGYEELVEEQLRELMFHLLNQFHYLYYDEERLKEDEEQLARYHRIVKYLSNNYMNRIQLSDLAEKEYLSRSYLSSQIKETFGQGFKEYLNQIRVEEATKLLLDTKLNISRISEEVGFSHVRYFNQHFKRHYHMTPSEYRKKYSLSDEEVDALTVYEELPWKEAFSAMKTQLEDWNRFYRDDEIHRINLDWEAESIEEFQRPSVIDMGEASLWMEEENRLLFIDIQQNIKFQYGIIRQLFSADMDIYRGKNRRFINWTRVEGILEFFIEQKLTPIIETQGVEKYILEDFIENFSPLYGEEEVKCWLQLHWKDLHVKPLPLGQDDVYDTLKVIPIMMENAIHDDELYFWQAVDMITKDVELSNDTFFGGRGLCTANYLKKPVYYAMSFLAMMGTDVLDVGENHLFTREGEEYQLLFFNGELPEIQGDHYVLPQSREKKLTVNLYNPEADYTVTRFDLNEHHGSVYDQWQALGSPERIPDEHWHIFSQFVHPDINVSHLVQTGIFNLVVTLKDASMILFKFKS